MHDVRSSVGSQSDDPEDVLPMSVLESVKNAEFWRELDDVPLNDDTVEDAKNTIKLPQRFFGEDVDSSDDNGST